MPKDALGIPRNPSDSIGSEGRCRCDCHCECDCDCESSRTLQQNSRPATGTFGGAPYGATILV
eukprot:5257413-Pyramimonas_sp.AAC.1